MAKKSKRAIAEAQRVRQQRVRDEARERRRRSRDDLARVLLWQMIKAAEKSNIGQQKALDGLRDKIVDGWSFRALMSGKVRTSSMILPSGIQMGFFRFVGSGI